VCSSDLRLPGCPRILGQAITETPAERGGGGTLLLLRTADLPRLHQEVRAAVLAEAVFARLAAEEPFLAVADDRDPVRPDALGDRSEERRARAPIAEREVVLG